MCEAGHTCLHIDFCSLYSSRQSDTYCQHRYRNANSRCYLRANSHTSVDTYAYPTGR